MPQFAPVIAEYKRTKRLSKSTPEWFSLYGGPKNRVELSEALGLGTMYQLLYGDWSTLAHGNDLNRYLGDHSGRLVYDGVRRPNELQSISQFAALLLLKASRAMIERFRKGENLEPWYLRDVKPLMNKLSALKLTLTPLHEE